jgi:hypothetical protein
MRSIAEAFLIYSPIAVIDPKRACIAEYRILPILQGNHQLAFTNFLECA